MTHTLGAALMLFAASLMLAAPLTRADPAGDQQQQLDSTEQQLQSSQSAQDRITAGIEAAIREQEDISARLVDISQKTQSEEAAITGSEEDLGKLDKERATILASLGEKQDVLSELLAGLQRLQQNPPPALVVEPGDVLAALRGAMMFGTIVPELRDEAARLADDLSRLDRLQAGIKTRRDDIRAEIARLGASRGDLTGLVARKKDLVSSGNAELANERKRATDLAGKASSLKQLMASLAAARSEAAIRQAQQTAASEAARRQKEAALQKPRMIFADAKGKLAYPAQGQILKHFGDDDGLGGTIQGTVIATRDDATVTTPADGHVEFAGPFRSYGQVLILNPGNGYHILIAGLGAITAQTGEFLRAGEPVGRMGNGPSSVTLLGDVIQDKRPVLYIEFRNNTDAIDSSPWWIGGTKEARG